MAMCGHCHTLNFVKYLLLFFIFVLSCIFQPIDLWRIGTLLYYRTTAHSHAHAYKLSIHSFRDSDKCENSDPVQLVPYVLLKV